MNCGHMVVCKSCVGKIERKCFICNSDIIKIIKTVSDGTINAGDIAKGTHNDLMKMESDMSMSVIKEDTEYFSKEILSLESEDNLDTDQEKKLAKSKKIP
jgi:Zinc finger, C3HC4 type (RING finger)